MPDLQSVKNCAFFKVFEYISELLHEKKRDHKRLEFRRIEAFKHKKPRDLWRLFSKRRQGVSDQIHIQDFFTDFRRLSTEINEVDNNESETFNAEHSFNGADTNLITI